MVDGQETSTGTRRYIVKAVLAASVYTIWNERNSRLFQNQSRNSSVVVKSIIQHIHVRAANNKKSDVQRFCIDKLNYYPS